ncbi:short chain dehydrogenase [Lasiosphaeria miniovina]|uniref:Short chain dehydrogenase n=1 Tax=Lasiosphaeria miniovina TaxID=1954250 RepID=A0AA39ZYI9_9PEZI|nr:short chain dehydrogenase [Lasiosphaeria miniovina]KAK0706003.1 short chain dehydrogenase [Lasiosphaeria miniovina]
MSTQTTYLITGANRGIGKGFVSTLLSRPSTTVIAAVRDPSHATSRALSDLPKAAGSKLITVKLDSSVTSAAADAVATLKKNHDITAIDVVVANAGIAAGGAPIRETTSANAIEHFNVNTIAPILLFQATADLLQASKTGNPKFIAISTLIGSIGTIDALVALNFPNTASPYGGSKAALNWFVRRLHFEEPWLTSFVFHPGLVETDLAASSITGTGLSLKDLGAISVETSVAGMTKTIDAATRDIGGTFQNHDGATNPW